METPEEPGRQEAIAQVNEKLAEHAEKGKEKHEGRDEKGKEGKHGKEGSDHSKGKHDDHGAHHGPKAPGFWSKVGKKGRRAAEIGVTGYAIGGGGLIIATEAGLTTGFAAQMFGNYAATSLGWTNAGPIIAHAGEAITGATQLAFATVAPYLLGVGLGVGCFFAGGFVVDRIANWLLGAKPAKGGGAKAADHGGGGHGGGH